MKKKSVQLRTALLLALTLVLSLSGLGSAPALAAGQTTVHASSTEELEAAVENIQSNTLIELEGKDYDWGGYLRDVENVTIQGTAGTRLVTHDRGDTVIAFYDCKNITLSGLTLGHDLPEGMDCVTGVISADNTDLTVIGCDIFGCGVNGLTAYGGSVTMKNSTIRDCSDYILDLGSGIDAVFVNCVFSGNRYKDAEWESDAVSAYAWDADVNITFTNCTFRDNRNSVFMSEDSDFGTAKVNLTLNNCLFENNGWPTPVSNGTGAPDGTAAPSTPSEPAAPAQPAGVTANPTSASVLVNGVSTAFDAYTIDGSNYFKLRDLAYVLNGTEKQFEVSWDSAANAISLIPGQPYTAVGGEMTAGTAGSKSASPTASAIVLNGAEIALTAYNIGGNNYFKLRDVGQTFDFGVGWDNDTKTITIDTSVGYTA